MPEPTTTWTEEALRAGGFENPKRAQIQAAAQVFGVHPHVVRNLLVYKGILPRETLEDQLEAA